MPQGQFSLNDIDQSAGTGSYKLSDIQGPSADELAKRQAASKAAFEAAQPSLVGGFGSELWKNTKNFYNAAMHTAPGTPEHPVASDFPATGHPVLDVALGGLSSGVTGPASVTRFSPLAEKLLASPAAQTVQAAGNLVKGGTKAVAEYIRGDLEPVDSLTRGLKPIATNTNFAQHAERAMGDMKLAESQIGKPVESVADMGNVIDQAKKNVWAEYAAIKGPQAARGVDASPVADAIENSISDKVRAQDPAKVAAISKLADTYRRTMTIDQLDSFLKTTNAENAVYYGKYPAAQRIAQAANPDLAQNVAEGNALRSLIDDQLGGVRDLKQRYGSLMNMEKEVQRRLNVAARQQPNSLTEQLGTVGAAMQAAKGIAKGVGGIATGNPGLLAGSAADLVSAAAGRSMASAIKEANTADALVANAFKNYKGPIPSPMVPRVFQLAGLLESGAHPMPAGPDTSFVKGTPAQPAISGAPRLLTSGARQMPAAPDTSFVKGAPAEYGALTGERQELQSRLNQLRDIARSGATETTGNALRAFNEQTGEVGPVLRRGGGGFKTMFPELKNFTESPSEIAAAIDKGKGALYSRIEYVVRKALASRSLEDEDVSFPFGENER